MLKKIISGILAFSLVFGATGLTGENVLGDQAVITAEAETLTYGDYEYELTSDSSAIRILKYIGSDTDVIIPDNINGIPVEYIGETGTYNWDYDGYVYNGAFENNKTIVSVTIPDSVIGINGESFSFCSKLETVKLSDNLTYIDDRAFYTCSSLKSIVFPETLEEVGDDAFYYCSNLEYIDNIDVITSIGANAFGSTKWLNVQRENDPLVIINNTVIDGRTIKGTAVIPDGITAIANGAFRDTITVTDVVFPETLTTIEENAFEYCEGLTQLILPDSLTYVGDHAFQYCTALKVVRFPKNTGTYNYEYGVFRGCHNIKEITFESNVDFEHFLSIVLDFEDNTPPSDVLIRCNYSNSGLSAYKYATENGYEYELLNIFDGFAYTEEGLNRYRVIAYIGDENSVTIPSTIKGIDVRAVELSEDTKVQNITIPNGVEILAVDSSNTTIESINIPASVTSGTLRGSAIKKVKYDEGCTETLSICTELASLETVELPKSIKTINYNAFFGCESLVNITIPDGVTSIEGWAFAWCESLTNITIPDGVTSIGNGTFWGCTSLTSITIPKSVTEISEENVFVPYAKLTIYCFTGSCAHAYAKNNKINYILLDAPEDEVVGSVEIPGIGNIPGMDITDIEITFTDENGEEYDATVTEDGDIMLPMLPAGEYKVTASMENCPSRDYNITVKSGKPLALDIELKLYGDISGDGKITAVDSAMVNAYVMKTGKLDDYDQKVADVIGNDGSVTAVDCSRINAHVQKTNLLW